MQDFFSIQSEDSPVFLDIKVARSPIIQVSLGGQHTCVLFQNKKVTYWGRNHIGQLGLSHNTNTPIGKFEVPLLRDYARTGDQEFVNLFVVPAMDVELKRMAREPLSFAPIASSQTCLSENDGEGLASNAVEPFGRIASSTPNYSALRIQLH